MQLLTMDNLAPLDGLHTAVALGTFDGLHAGHMRILEELKAHAKGLPTLAYAFAQPPAMFFGRGTGMLFTREEKLEHFAAAGIDYLLLVEFNARLAAMPARAFADVLLHTLHARVLAAGYNYTFGRAAEGDSAMLRAYADAHGAQAVICAPVERGGAPVSSTRIRAALARGEIALANSLLGYAYALSGRVTHGKQLARQFGLPTVNFSLSAGKVCPAHGVYASRACWEGNDYPAITNIGRRPTVADGDAVNVETHIIGYAGDLYGKEVCVRLFDWIRPEQRFSSVEALFDQLKKDRQTALQCDFCVVE